MWMVGLIKSDAMAALITAFAVGILVVVGQLMISKMRNMK
jgi:hypothetical protein